MSSAAETIKDRLGIVEVVSSYMKIDKAGANYKGRCPFHHEKTPSFFVSPARNSYYCFGCGAKGDIFTFVQEFEKVDFLGALKLLAERAGIELTQFKDEKKGEMDRLRGVLDIATGFYENRLSKNTKALEYLRSRGLTDKTIADWRIGYAENEWRTLHDFLLTKRVGELDMEAVGLIKKSDRNDGSVYDRFRARVIFPLFDPSSRVIGYSGRIFGVPDSDGPKYLNSPDTVLFNKSEVLYGYHKAKDGIREWRYAILVEGQMDLLMCHQSGFTNAVATSGTSLTHLHLEKLKKLSDNLMLVYDADKAGLKATLRAWTSALALGMDVKVASLPKGEDPASLLLSNKDAFKDAIKHSKHIIDYYIDILLKEKSEGALSEASFKKAVEKEVLPYVAAVESAIERSNFISRVSVQTGIYESDLREETEKIRANPKKDISGQLNGGQSDDYGGKEMGKISYSNQNTGTQSGAGIFTKNGEKNSWANILNDVVVRRIAAVAVWLKSKGGADGGMEKSEKMEKEIERILSKDEFTDFKRITYGAPEDLIFEAEILFQGSKRIDKDIEDLLQELEERTLKTHLSDVMAKLGMAEKKKDIAEGEKLLKSVQEISEKLAILNRKKKE